MDAATGDATFVQRKLRRARIDPNGPEHPEIDVDDVPRFAGRVHPVTAGIVHVCVEEPRQRFARVLAVETDDPSTRPTTAR